MPFFNGLEIGDYSNSFLEHIARASGHYDDVPRKLAAEVLALRDANIRAADLLRREWQPIESAPRDGRMLLLAKEGTDRVNRAWWQENRWCMVGGQWTPTHWQPCPDAPGK